MTRIAMVMLLSVAAPLALSAADARAQDRGDAAFLFAYTAKPGMAEAFEDGYRRHLEWHQEHGDSLAWLAWTVAAGPRVGMFVDGTFGIPFRAFDERVDPRGDAEDAAANVTAFADPVTREVYRLRRELGSAARLEAGRPAPMQKVVRLTLRPGSEAAFERALRELAQRDAAARLDYAVYERVVGGAQPGFLVVVQLGSWAELGDPRADAGRAVLRAAGSAVVSAESEVWLYRPDLSYFPGAELTRR
ncbi:MAG: hypothetical protein ACOC8B_06010 [Gemmatimonadota bacterium]